MGVKPNEISSYCHFISTDNGYPEAGSKQGRDSENCTVRVNDPIRNPNSPTTDTHNCSIVVPPTQSAIETLDAPIENGYPCMGIGDSGNPNKLIIGAHYGLHNSTSSPGNLNPLSFFGPLAQAPLDQLGKLINQGYQETTRDGAKVREPKDGGEFFFDMLKGLPTHGAMNGLNGTIIPELKEIQTAIQQFGAGLSGSMLSSLPGQLMSLSSLFSKMSSSQKQQIKEKMPREVADGFESMINLYQAPDDAVTDIMITGRVEANTFMNSAVQILSQVTTLSDLSTAFVELNTNPTLRGEDKLAKVQVTSETMHGTIYLDLDYDGNLELQGYPDIPVDNIAMINYLDDANAALMFANTDTTAASSGTAGNGGGGGQGGNQQVLQAIQKFASLLGNGMLNTGTSFQDNLWKDQAKKMAEVMGRTANGKKFKAQSLLAAAKSSGQGGLGFMTNGTAIRDLISQKTPAGIRAYLPI